MRHPTLVCIVSASLAIAVSAAAQDQPDFSGRWVLVSSAVADPNAARSLNIRQPVRVTNALGAPMAPYFLELIVEREFADRVTTETHTIGVGGGIVGGVAGGDLAGARYQSRFSVRWEGDRLVIERGSYSGQTRDAVPYWEHTEEWEMDAAGMLVVTVTDRASDAAPKSNTFMYRRN
jgi:hypothetical protein